LRASSLALFPEHYVMRPWKLSSSYRSHRLESLLHRLLEMKPTAPVQPVDNVSNRDLPRVTYVGGPTAVLEWHGLRLLTDPTFDPAGTTYELPAYTLRKTAGPAVAAAEIGAVDAVMLSHEHHFDNLDHGGRALVATVPRVLTTESGAATLGSRATGLAPWETVDLAAPDGATVRVTATPARHGPAHGDRGPVIGFVLDVADETRGDLADETRGGVYFSGDTVFYDGVTEIADRFDVAVALLCLGAARVSAVGDSPLTLTAAEAVGLAHLMPSALIVPLHFEGWEHFSESRPEIDRAFTSAGLRHRLLWAKPGEPTELP
jgi:L-ascorbate metabolism protein UlaG (beta-lactamase superfamily)